MTKTEMKAICKPLGMIVDCKWGEGFIVMAKTSREIADKLQPLGFTVKGIGLGFDYNASMVSLFAKKEEV